MPNAMEFSGWTVKVSADERELLAPVRQFLAASLILDCPYVLLPPWPFHVIVQNNLNVAMNVGTGGYILCGPYTDSY